MNLSNTLFASISNRLKAKVSLLNEERFYVKNLKTQIDSLKKIKENNYKNLSVKKLSVEQDVNQNLIVMYVINISFLKANTIINVSDIKGNMKLFYSSGSVGLSGKQKRKRRIAVFKLMSLLLQKATFIKNKPVALHLNNVTFYKNLIISKLKRSLYLRVIKSFNQTPYNGCRKKKVRRKKYTKKFK
uniref:Ribosomal protein S11 n=1 Tax=Nitzschia sp. (in: diatoms) TaxID=1884248 RepID=A0A2U9GIV6_9STRA|nr:ribosomal protein S11 [Nitzschia sp. (in: diatoms)]AWQ64296.1 ribosomal protein S11 [Nitzschia sp. (in: diatoms)]